MHEKGESKKKKLEKVIGGRAIGKARARKRMRLAVQLRRVIALGGSPPRGIREMQPSTQFVQANALLNALHIIGE